MTATRERSVQMTRAEAKAAREAARLRGDKHYAGTPLRCGHGSIRYVSCDKCIVCVKARVAKQVATNPEKFRTYSVKYRAEHKEELRAKKAKYHAENSEKLGASQARRYRDNPAPAKARSAKWRRDNLDRAKATKAKYYLENVDAEKARSATWRRENVARANAPKYRWARENPEKTRASKAKWAQENPGSQRASRVKRRALERDQLCGCCTEEQFAAFYALSGPGTEVDHITPLAVGALLGLKGLHCLKNLQILSTELHAEKTYTIDRALIAQLKREKRTGTGVFAPTARITVRAQTISAAPAAP